MELRNRSPRGPHRAILPMLFPCLALAIGTCCDAQPWRAVEVFGTAGAMRGASDEGSAGSAAAFGGAATIPFRERWAVDVQALTASLSNHPDFLLRRVLLSPGILYRRGNERSRWFIAAGPGLQMDRSRGEFQVADSAGQPRTVAFSGSENGLTLHWRTGAVFQPNAHLLVRAEFFWVNRHVLPTLGAAVSLGIRLGR